MDVLEWSNNTLERLGYCATEDEAVKSLAHVFTITRTLIPPIPRKVKVAKGFNCPSHLKAGYNQLITEIVNGTDLSPRGSRKQTYQFVHVDKMLADWNIYHLHLGTEFIEKGRKKG